MQASDDPEVVRVLSSISQLRHERDNLTLDLQQAQRALAAADAKIAYLEDALAKATIQRDSFMGKLIEAATHHASIRGAFEKADKALTSVALIAKTNGNGDHTTGEPGEMLTDGSAKAIAAKFSPRDGMS